MAIRDFIFYPKKWKSSYPHHLLRQIRQKEETGSSGALIFWGEYFQMIWSIEFISLITNKMVIGWRLKLKDQE